MIEVLGKIMLVWLLCGVGAILLDLFHEEPINKDNRFYTSAVLLALLITGPIGVLERLLK